MKIETLLFKEIIIFPELFLGIALIYLVLHCTFLAIQKKYPLIQISVSYLSILIIFFSIYLVYNEHLSILEFSCLNDTIVIDYVSFISKLVIGILSIFCMLMIQPYILDNKINSFEYFLLIIFSVLGLFLLCSSNDLLTSYLAIELQSLSFYVLAAFKKNSTFSVDAGLKYFILGSFASSLFLFGSSLLYGLTGTICFEDFKLLFIDIIIEGNYDYIDEYLILIQENIIYEFSTTNCFLDCDTTELIRVLKTLEIIEDNYDYIDYYIDEYLILIQENIIYEFSTTNCFLDCDTTKLIRVLKTLDFLTFLKLIQVWCDIDSMYAMYGPEFDYSLIKFALMLILVSLFFKLTIAPFHTWAVDVYEGAPTSSTFFFSVVPKLAIFVLLLRIFYYSFYGFIDSYRNLITLVLIFSIIVGSFGGLEQKKLKSLFVYSTISHMGYSLIAFSSGTFESLQMLISYLIIYSFSGLCVWSIFISTRLKNNYFQKQNKDLTDLVLLSKSNYMLAIFFTTVLFSIAGFPPLIGFLVKLGVFLSALESSMYFVAFISILCSVVGTFYYLRLIKILYFEKVLVGKLYYPIKFQTSIITTFLFFLLIFLFINPTLLFLISHKFSLLVFM